MTTIKDFLTADHGRCDEYFADMEAKATESLSSAKESCEAFIHETEKHFQMEERVVFEEFETKTGMTQGPTAMMRHEHTQMRGLMAQMLESIAADNKDKFFGTTETFMILQQQHNMKEEQMLYPMVQQHLGEESERIVEMIDSLIVE